MRFMQDLNVPENKASMILCLTNSKRARVIRQRGDDKIRIFVFTNGRPDSEQEL